MTTTRPRLRELTGLVPAVRIPIPRQRRIAVVSARGGVGRSTVTVLLGSIFTAHRGDPVVVTDADPDHGSLAWRLGLPEGHGLAQLAPRLLAARGIAEVDALLPTTPAGLRLLPGPPLRTPTHAGPDITAAATRALTRFFAICVSDCGQGLRTGSTTGAVRDAHAVVLVVPTTPDGVRSTITELTRIPPTLRARMVIVLNTTDRGGLAALDLDTARANLAATGASTLLLPYDRHLAGGTPVHPRHLAEATTIEATRLAGHVLRRAQDTGT